MNIAGGEKFGAHRTVCLSPQVHLNHLGDLGGSSAFFRLNRVRIGISKRGNEYLRRLFIHGAHSVLQLTGSRADRKSRWAEAVKGRRGDNIAAVALAAKHARILWAMLVRGEVYQLAV